MAATFLSFVAAILASPLFISPRLWMVVVGATWVVAFVFAVIVRGGRSGAV